MSELLLLRLLLVVLPIPLVVLAGVILYLFNKPEKFDQWGVLFYRLIQFMARYWTALSERIETGVVGWQVQAAINTGGEGISKEAPGVLPHAMRIEWVRNTAPEAFIKGGKVIVRMRHHANQDKNIVVAAQVYVGHELLPKARHYLDVRLRRATSFAVVRHILSGAEGTGAYSYFFKNEFEPAVIDDPELSRDSSMLDDIDTVGFFTRVFLNDVRSVAEMLPQATPGSALQANVSAEIRDFAKFLQVIATKGRKENVPLDFAGTRIKTGLVLVARPERLKVHGIEPYVRRVRLKVESGTESIYISGWGEEFISAVRDIARSVSRNGWVHILRRYEFPILRYRGDVGRGLLAVTQPKSSYLAKQRELARPVRAALAKHVPEILDDSIEVVGVARILGFGSKVSVRFAGDEYNAEEAVRRCVGYEGKTISMIENELPESELITIVPWKADLSEFICRSFYTSSKTPGLISIRLDEEELVATVSVADKDTRRRLLGRDGKLMRLSERLTGWGINIVVVPSSSREELIRKMLRAHIPEIASGEVEVVRMATKENVGTKVAIRYRDQEDSAGDDIVERCRGERGEKISPVEKSLSGEWITLVPWSAESMEFIVKSLYPLNERDVVSFEIISQSDAQCHLTVDNKRAMARAMGKGHHNLHLAEELTGWAIVVDTKR